MTTANAETPTKAAPLGGFEKWLSLWIALAIVADWRSAP